jgi:hypothetical protein
MGLIYFIMMLNAAARVSTGGDWLMGDGTWDDEDVWDDEGFWTDEEPLI